MPQVWPKIFLIKKKKFSFEFYYLTVLFSSNSRIVLRVKKKKVEKKGISKKYSNNFDIR